MSAPQRKHIRPLVLLGNALIARIPRELLARLGWNRHDNICFEIVQGALILTKVKLPSVEHLRRTSLEERDGG